MQSSILGRTAARQCINATTRRQLSSSSRRWQAEATETSGATVVDAGSVRPKKPIGGFRGGVFGFLLGFSVASAYASYRLLEEYKIASALLQASVEELQASTDKVGGSAFLGEDEQLFNVRSSPIASALPPSQISTHVRRIETVEKNLKALSEASATKEESKKAKAELKKLYDGLHVEFLDLRSHVWGMQQDLHALVKKEATSLRPS
ncbi:hypothetical protein FRC01_010829 [Tulasnella sp. 417]|nr:hypothetical protein FRC01_010829 [Tulasnella sp. 417]